MSAVARFAFLDHDGPIAFAHRGGASEAPENTLPAFQRAVDLGYRYLETDVHVTADGQLLAFHDDRLDRVTDGRGMIAELSYDTVRRARVDGREPIPLLADLLDAFPDARINIDAKSDGAVEPLMRVLREFDALDRVCVGGFSHSRLERIRSGAGPGLCTSMSPREVGLLRTASVTHRRLAPSAVPCAQVPTRQGALPLVDRAFVRVARRLGIQVHVWTIDDPAEMHRLLDLGVDGIMTDRPSVLRDVLTQRGQWPTAS